MIVLGIIAGVEMTDEMQETIVKYGAACALRAMNEYRGKA